MSDSDSEDMSSVEDESETDVEMETEDQQAEEDNTHEDIEGEGDGDDAASDDKSPFQKEIWQLKHLPYYVELEKEADDYFRHIKAGLAHAVLLKDIRMGLIHWICELEKYITLYQRRMTKEDHVQLIHLVYGCVSKEHLFRDVKICCHILNLLLGKRELLSATDLQLDWRPLFELYYELSYKNLEEDGVFLLPEGFRSDVSTLIGHARNYWKPEATQQLLDELRPYFCPWDESMIRAFKMLDLFLPTCLTVEQHKDHGAGLWFEEFWHWYTKVENNSAIDDKLLRIFARLAWDCPGLIDWQPYLDLVFTKITRSLRLGSFVGLCQSMHMDTAVLWVTYMMGGANHDIVQGYISRLFQVIESFCHPSNFGSHTSHVLNCLYKMAHHLVLRVKRDRFTKKQTFNAVPSEMLLTDAQIEAYAQSMIPCLSLAIFSKGKTEYIPYIVRDLASVAPKVVIPAILDILYDAIAVVNEPHRLTQALHPLLSISLALMRDTPPSPDTLSNRSHCLVLMQELLPGLDRNDISKSMLTFQVLGVMVNLIPLSDCSSALHARSDLSADEKELCGLSARTEDNVCMITDRLLNMVELSVSTTTAGAHPAHGALTKQNAKLSLEEQVTLKGVSSVFKGLTFNSSTQIYKIVVKKLYQFMEEALYDSKVAADSVAEMCYLAVRSYPDASFDRFLDLTVRHLKKHITPESYDEERPEFAVIWWLTVATKVVRVPSEHLLRRKDTLTEMLRLIMPLQSRTASHLSCTALEDICRHLTSIYPLPVTKLRSDLDKPVEQFLPIRHWARAVDKKNLHMEWMVPSKEGIAFADELLREWLYPLLEVLRNPVDMKKSDILHRLYLVESAVIGCAFSLPRLSGEAIPLNDSPVFVYPFEFAVKPEGTPVLHTPVGGNVRDLVLSSMSDLLNYLLQNREDDVKSINMIIRILNVLIFSRGITKEKHTLNAQNYSLTKRIMSDPLRGNKLNPEWVTKEFVALQHQKHVVAKSGYLFTQAHIDVIRILIGIATSQYSENRVQAQNLLQTMFKEFPYSYNKVLDEILAFLDPSNSPTHEQLKGALYIIADGKRLSLLLRQNWEALLKLWPSLVSAKHSEKPSIVALIETAQNTIVDKFESFRICEEMPDEVVKVALRVLNETSGDAVSQRHAPAKGMPSEDQLQAADRRWKSLNEKNLRLYYELCSTLLARASDPSLHWRHTDLAYALLSLMIRRDVRYPEDALKLFIRLLVHDTVKTRKMAGAVVGAWLHINKPRSVRKEWKVEMEPNTGPGARWPIRYGLRRDNRDMCYEEDRQPKTPEEFDNFRFCGKQHWGFYTWPKKLMTYATLSEQSTINRSESEFSECEAYIVEMFRDPAFSSKFRDYMSVEEKKGDDGDDVFNSVNFTLFHGLFRNFNESLCPVFRDHLEVLCASSKESHQKLAAEMAAGIVNGSKLWRYEKQARLWEWLAPLLTNTLSDLKEDAQKNWGVAIATMSGSCEARMLQPLIDVLFGLLAKPTESNFQLSARVFLIQGAVCQWEWRALSLWHRLLPMLAPFVVQGYQNLRERLGVCLTTIAWFDMPTVFMDPSLPSNLRLPTFENCLALIDPHLGPVWDEALLRTVNAEAECPMDGQNGSGNGKGLNGEDEAKKQSRLALKTLLGFLFNASLQSYIAWPKPFVNYIPLLAHFSNDVGDEEMKKYCTSLYRDLLSNVYVTEENVLHVVTVIEKYLSGPSWWKAKQALLKNLRLLVFSNMFTFSPVRERIGLIIAELMKDCQIEVREAACEVFSGLVHCGFFEHTPQLMHRFEVMARDKKASVPERHAGVLGMAGVVLAFPYSVPQFLPDVLMKLCRHASDQNPMRDTVKKALAEFKRTHQDSWHEHKTCFSDDQLTVLTDLLVSPNYYV